MNIPKSVKIGGKRYSVVMQERIVLDGAQKVGAIWNDAALIQIDATLQDYQTQCQTLLHEIIHGIGYFLDADWKSDEKIVTQLENGLFQVIMDNPRLFAPKEKTAVKRDGKQAAAGAD